MTGPVGSQTLDLTGLQQPVTVTFSPQGIASISAATEQDLFLALGYVHARFRRSLGPARTIAWFPVIAPNTRSRYDPGPCPKSPLVPLAPGAASTQTASQLAATQPEAADPGPAASTTARSAVTGA